MNRHKEKIDVCIATYKRPSLLLNLLNSLNDQNKDVEYDLRIIVIDNDLQETAKEVVEKFISTSSLSVKYDVVSQKNISLTRNRAIDISSGDFIVFVDDDEFVCADWLSCLLKTAKKFDASVVFGPVLPSYPPETPSWIISGGFFDRPRFRSGTVRHDGGAGNVLINLNTLNSMNIRFNPDFGLTGGEDSEFFHRIHSSGVKMVWCDEAIAYEHIPFERMTIRWLVLRSMRIGQTLAQVRSIILPYHVRCYYFVRRIGLFPAFLILLIFALPFGRHRWVNILRRLSGYVGYLSTITKYRYREYE